MQTINWQNNSISKLCLGTAQFGLNYGIANATGKPSQNGVTEIIKFAHDNHINCYDTAMSYGNSEQILGDIFNKLNIKNTNIITKISSDNIANIENLLDSSLKLLNQSTLFGLLLHDSKILHEWNNKHNINIRHLKKLGKFKYFGASIYNEEEFELALSNESIDIIQIPFNLFDHRALNLKWINRSNKNNKLVLIRSIFLQGLILMDSKDIPESLSGARKHNDMLNQICKELNINKSQLALSFVNQSAPDAIIIFGCETLLQAQENINMFCNLPKLNHATILKLFELFANIPENIYNPSKWNKI